MKEGVLWLCECYEVSGGQHLSLVDFGPCQISKQTYCNELGMCLLLRAGRTGSRAKHVCEVKGPALSPAAQ